MAGGPFPSKRSAIYAIVLVLLVAGRGHLLATSMGGRYLWSSLLSDVFGFALLIGGIKLVDVGVQRVFSFLFKRMTESPRCQRAGATACRLVFLILVVCPFLLATLQIHPQRVATRGTPADSSLPYENVTFTSRGRDLQAWLVESPTAKGVVLVAHGLNANRENFLPPVELLHAIGYTAMIFDFPAHGDSPGRSITMGLTEAHDVHAAAKWLKKRFPNHPIRALGYSMGASAVLTAAGNCPDLFDKIIVDSTFARVRDVAEATVLRPFGPFKTPLWTSANFWIQVWTGADLNDHQPELLISHIKSSKLLIIHGTADSIIPHDQGQRLHEATNRQATFRSVAGYGHAETISHPNYASWLGEFFKPIREPSSVEDRLTPRQP